MRAFIICTILIFCFLVIGCGYHLIKVPTGAMQSTIEIDSNVITDDTAFSSDQPIERFDIVIHKAPIVRI